MRIHRKTKIIAFIGALFDSASDMSYFMLEIDEFGIRFAIHLGKTVYILFQVLFQELALSEGFLQRIAHLLIGIGTVQVGHDHFAGSS